MKALILHYGVGNIFSISHAFKRLGFEVKIVDRITGGEGEFDCLVMPGVGSFTAASENISRYKEELKELISSGIPTLGICLGMQILFNNSEEGPGEGLGIVEGKVISLPDNVKRPHMGWNKIRRIRYSPLIEDIEEAWVYFNHTYYPYPDNTNTIVAVANHGVHFTAIITQNNVYGTQFHPEKSSKTGEKILNNFKNIVRR